MSLSVSAGTAQSERKRPLGALLKEIQTVRDQAVSTKVQVVSTVGELIDRIPADSEPQEDEKGQRGITQAPSVVVEIAFSLAVIRRCLAVISNEIAALRE